MGSELDWRPRVARRLRGHFLIGLLAMLLSHQSFAALVTYEAAQLSGNTWRYDYSVANDTLSGSIDELTIFFDLGQYATLIDLDAPVGWDGFIAQPDPLLPDDGFIDLLALTTGVVPGESLSGFSIVFDWLSEGAPGSQRFDIIDAATFTILESGFTTPAASTTPVPEPAGLALFGAGLLGLGWLRRRGAQVGVSTDA